MVGANGGAVTGHWNKVSRIGNLYMMGAAGAPENEVWVAHNLDT